ncbi:DnaB-like helicase C-terminal domain-containing protein [Streptomyces sp. NPDC051064]|uniref:DnaB-like helicase C-terminal domain-containing protein n=1 Tax=Streptomyces sp. NPDC051064 TaxID=3365641 RepID=UPI0037986F85
MTADLRTDEIFTGLSDFDALAGPIPRGRVTLVAARSSTGTTAFALSVARHNDEVGRQVVIASFESGTDTLMGNLVAATTSVNVDRPLSINKGRRARIERGRTAMEQSRLSMWSSELKAGRWPFRDLSEQLAARPGLDLIIVDGYGLASNDEPSEGATFAVLQRLANERNIAVLVTAYLTPQDDTPETDLPALTELSRLDGSVTEAETVMLLHRPDRNGTVPQRRGEVDLIAVRGWEGTGSATVHFEPEYHRFVDLPNA